jgi:hypothetical protein
MTVPFKVQLELIPKSCWGSNLRSLLTNAEWDSIRTKVKSEANHACSICQTTKGSLHAHEVWSFNDSSLIQKLESVICICSKCHLVKHFGFARVQKKDKEALEHFKVLNACTHDEAMEHVAESFELWAERSGKSWKLDISNLNKFLIKNNNPFLNKK